MGGGRDAPARVRRSRYPRGRERGGGSGGAAGAPLATRRQCCRSKVRQLLAAPLLAAAAATGGDRSQGGGRLLLHITLRYTAQRTAEPRLRITTGYVPELPQQRRDTTAAAAAGSIPPPHSGGGAGGGVALATVRRCHCTAAVAAHIERSQRCQLPPAGAAAATGAMQRGNRRGPVSERGRAQQRARAAEVGRAETP